ncbi:[citrate (pro-3S)-lyase] ligase [Pantoea sp. BAV 3049]|uniref:[citrate (pro-3S)-lyase] ligase n=1 Tax=Pantoea sp. BAV 3049 TaxID=2654188 RepID=UPI00131D164E|nr:[citrate (pro-3S)-lyase] ligase [Pantoea sp. BAV 3049]
MSGQVVFNRVYRNDDKAVAEIKCFLRENELYIDRTIRVFVTAIRQGKLVACGGIADNIIKCVAVSPDLRGEGLGLALATELVNLAWEMDQTQLFIYTKTQNESLFRQCGFHPIAHVPGIMVLMENSPCRLSRYAAQLADQRKPGEKIGSIVMNANPFTLGHHYLVQQAAAACDWLHLFLVREDNSRFRYQDRLDLVTAGTQGIANLTIHEGSQYIISRATFPCYFIKEKGIADECYTEIDLKIFRQYLAPSLGITHRFVGNEPFCEVTAKYNRDMRYWLNTPALAEPPVELVEIERLKYNGTPISASWVRKLLPAGDIQAIAPLVPEATKHFLECLLAKRQEIAVT